MKFSKFLGKICYFLLICAQIVAPGVQDKHLNRSKHTLAHQFLSYMTLKSHWRCLSTKLRHQDWILEIEGAKSAIFAFFDQFLVLETKINI